MTALLFKPRAAQALTLAAAAFVAGASWSSAQQAPPADPLESAAMGVAPGRDAASNHDDRAHPKGDAQRALRQRALQARLAGKSAGKTHRVAKGQYVELEREGEDLIWTVLGQFGNADQPHLRRRRRAGPQPDPAARSHLRQHDDLGSGLLPPLLREPAVLGSARRRVDAQLLHRDLVEPLRGRRRGHRLGAGALQRGQLRRELLRQHRLRPYLAVRARLVERLVRRPDRGGQDAAADRRLPGPVRRVGSLRLRRRRQLRRAGRLHRSLPVGARRHGEETGGGAQGSNAIWSHRWYAFYNNDRVRPARPATSAAACRSATAATGSATTRSSPRTAASACSRTSSATTSVCPTSTTRSATTRPASGRSCRPAPTATTARSTSARSRRTWARGRSSSSAG